MLICNHKMKMKRIYSLTLLLTLFGAIKAQPKLDVDIISGSISSNPKYYTEFQSKLYFQGYEGKNGRELWEYDGKSTPTMTADIYSGSNSNSSNPSEFCVFNNKLYFSATEGTDGYELWEYDGKNSPKQVKDIYSGSMSSSPKDMVIYKGKMYFSARDSAHGYEFWSVDSSNNISLVADIYKGTKGSYSSQFIIYNDTIFFKADDGSSGDELWAYAGSGSPFMVANIASGSNYSLPGFFAVMNGCLYFSASASSTYGRELYKYSSKTGAVTLVKDIWSGSSSSNPNELYTYNGQLYFQALVTGYGYELMTCNSKDSVWRVLDIRSGSGSGNPMDFYEYDSKLYFRATDGKVGEELWVYDGKNSPSVVLDIDSGSGSSYPIYFTEFNNNLYFTADNGKNGSEIWIIENCPSTSTTIDTVEKCNSYKWKDGKTYSSSTSSPFLKYTNKQGCDSIIRLNLTIHKTDYYYDSINACSSFKWVNGTTYTKSNYSDTFLYQNRYGCDSIIYLKLNINQPSTGIDTIIACDSITWIDSITYYKSTNSPTFTLKNQWGCDSVVTLNLKINYSKKSTDKIIACNSYKWIDGIIYKQSTQKPTYTLNSSNGCDSVVHLDLKILNSTTYIDTIIKCDSFTWDNGITYTQSTKTPKMTLVNSVGCDSTIFLNLTILKPTTFKQSIKTCDSFTWINGKTYSKSTKANLLTSNFQGCDSLIELDLTVNESTTGSDFKTACNSFVWLDGKTYDFNTNTPKWKIKNQKGCDSTITLNLTIIKPTYGTDTIESCRPIKWIDGKTYDSTTTLPKYTIQNSVGCDSIVTLNFKLRETSKGVDVISSCTPFQWIDGNTYSKSTNSPTALLTNQYGCDSFVTLNLTINPSTHSYDTAENCGSYKWIDGKTYTNSTTTPTYLIKNQKGCDSTIHLNLNILPMPSTNLKYEDNKLQSIQYNAIYQWLNCDNNFITISGATDRIYTPTENGNYALDIILNQCRDTSDCFNVSNLSTWKNNSITTFFPNPTKGKIQCNIEGIKVIEIYSLDGKKVHEINNIQQSDGQFEFFINHLEPSTYIVKIRTNYTNYIGRIALLE